MKKQSAFFLVQVCFCMGLLLLYCLFSAMFHRPPPILLSWLVVLSLVFLVVSWCLSVWWNSNHPAAELFHRKIISVGILSLIGGTLRVEDTAFSMPPAEEKTFTIVPGVYKVTLILRMYADHYFAFEYLYLRNTDDQEDWDKAGEFTSIRGGVRLTGYSLPPNVNESSDYTTTSNQLVSGNDRTSYERITDRQDQCVGLYFCPPTAIGETFNISQSTTEGRVSAIRIEFISADSA